MLEEWAARTPDGFRFVLKASRKITHIHRLKDVGEMTGYLFESRQALAEARADPVPAAALLKKDLDRLRRFCDGVPRERAIGVRVPQPILAG